MRAPVDLYHAANRAAVDSIRWGRDPEGAALATTRRNDAKFLRGLARQVLRKERT